MKLFFVTDEPKLYVNSFNCPGYLEESAKDALNAWIEGDCAWYFLEDYFEKHMEKDFTEEEQNKVVFKFDGENKLEIRYEGDLISTFYAIDKVDGYGEYDDGDYDEDFEDDDFDEDYDDFDDEDYDDEDYDDEDYEDFDEEELD